MTAPTSAHVLLSLAFVPHLDPGGTAFPLLAQGWTLNFEMFFYLVFAMGLMLPARRRFGQLAALLPALALLGLLLPEGLCAPGAGPVVARSAAYRVSRRDCHSPLGRKRLETGRGFWMGGRRSGRCGAALRAQPAGGGRLGAASSCSAFPAFLIVAGAVGVETSVKYFRAGPAPLLLGGASYSLYLSHTFVVSIVCKALGGGAHPWQVTEAATALSILVALVVYRFVEQPLLNVLRGRRARAALRVQAA